MQEDDQRAAVRLFAVLTAITGAAGLVALGDNERWISLFTHLLGWVLIGLSVMLEGLTIAAFVRSRPRPWLFMILACLLTAAIFRYLFQRLVQS